MLTELFHTGLQLTQMIGLVSLLWGALVLIGAVMGGRLHPVHLLQGAALCALGLWLAGVGQGM